MPVTQQLARLEESLLAQCAESVATLDDVCSFRALSHDRYVDLDWSPRFLLDVAAAADLDDRLQRQLDRSMSGEGEVNPQYREVPDSVFEHPVSSLPPDAVTDVSRDLSKIANTRFLTATHVSLAMDRTPRRESPIDPFAYLVGHFDALQKFYRVASTHGQAVAMWWD